MDTDAFPPGIRTSLGLTRAATETLVRRLLAKTCNNVRFISGTVLGVDAAVDRVALDAVRYRPASDASKSEIVKAALVVGKPTLLRFCVVRADQYNRLLGRRQRGPRLAPACRIPTQQGRARRELSPSHALHELSL
jgi:hypothetical protein